MKKFISLIAIIMALFVYAINASAQELKDTKDVVNLSSNSIIHDEEYFHTSVIIELPNGTKALGSYKVTIRFDGNTPIRLTYTLKFCDNAIFKKMPTIGEFETEEDSGDDSPQTKFAKMIRAMTSATYIEITYDR